MKTIKLVSLSVVMLSAASVLGADKPAPAPAAAPAAVAAPAAAPAAKPAAAPVAAAPAAKPAVCSRSRCAGRQAGVRAGGHQHACREGNARCCCGRRCAGRAAACATRPLRELVAFAKSLEGNWKCDTKIPAGGMGPGSPELGGQIDRQHQEGSERLLVQGLLRGQEDQDGSRHEGQFLRWGTIRAASR